MQRYHPPHDRRHQVNAIVSVDAAGVRASARWQFGSGPLAVAIGSVDMPGHFRLNRSEPPRGLILKARPNHGLYIEILRRMTPEQRLRKAFELGEMGREMFRQGLRRRHPGMSPDELRALERQRLEQCRNRSY